MKLINKFIHVAPYGMRYFGYRINDWDFIAIFCFGFWAVTIDGLKFGPTFSLIKRKIVLPVPNMRKTALEWSKE